MKKINLFRVSFTVIALALLCTVGQAANLDSEKKKGDKGRAESINNDSPFIPALGIHFGTQGLGMTFYGPIVGNFGFHAGGTILPVDTRLLDHFGGYDTQNTVEATASNAHLVLDWAPAGQAESFMKHFVVSAGGAYFFKRDGKFTTQLRDPFLFGVIEIPIEDVGEMVTDVQWPNRIAPYLGLGLHNLTVDDTFGVGFDFGAYYMGRPTVDIHSTKLLQGNEHNKAIIEDNLKSYRFLPVLQINLVYKFKK